MTSLRVGSLSDKINTTVPPNMVENKKTEDYKKQIKQLEKALEYANLKILGLETMDRVSEEDLQIKIRIRLVPNGRKNKISISFFKSDDPNSYNPRLDSLKLYCTFAPVDTVLSPLG